jgi:hypothetical protein
MKKRIWLITLALSMVPLGACAHEFTIRTVFGAVLCETPFQLRKAIIAARQGDGERVRQLDCIRSGNGIKTIVPDQIAPPFGPWRVRLMPNNAPSLTLWGYASDFESIHGDEWGAMPAGR